MRSLVERFICRTFGCRSLPAHLFRWPHRVCERFYGMWS